MSCGGKYRQIFSQLFVYIYKNKQTADSVKQYSF